MKKDHPILKLCLHLEVSASGYYDWQRRRLCPGVRAVEDQALAQEIGQIHTRSRRTYGAPRVEKELRKKGRCHGRNRVARLMKHRGLYGRQKGRYRVQTTDSNHDEPIRLTQATSPGALSPSCLLAAFGSDLSHGRNDAMSHTISTVLLTLAMFLVAWIASVEVQRAVRTGVTGLKSWPVALRARQPFWFWFCTAFQACLGAVCLWLGVRGVVSLLP
jgi:putative transposase